jgi:hypothetical protein
MYNQHQVMSTSNDMQGQVSAAANLAPNSQQDLPGTSSNLLAAGFPSRERLLQPAISKVGQEHQEICEITAFSLSGASQGLDERPQSPEERLQAASNQALCVQSYAHDVSIHPEEARIMMLSRQVPVGASRQSWTFIDGEEHLGEDEHHNTPIIEESFEPNQQHEKIVEWKEKKGHCLVPQRHEQDMYLGQWASKQRMHHRTTSLRIDRTIFLEEIGFGAGRPHEEIAETTEPAQGHVSNRSECPSPNRKRSRTSRQTSATTTNQRGNATGSCSSVEEDGGSRNDEDSNPSLVTRSALTGSDAEQEVVQEEATTHLEIPLGWVRVKLEPDC